MTVYLAINATVVVKLNSSIAYNYTTPNKLINFNISNVLLGDKLIIDCQGINIKKESPLLTIAYVYKGYIFVLNNYNNNTKDIIGASNIISFECKESEINTNSSTNGTYANTYTTMNGNDSAGYDIPGAYYPNATVEKCQTSCNNNPNCAGFAFGYGGCYPKTSSMYPVGNINVNPNVNLYVRNKMSGSSTTKYITNSSVVTPPIITGWLGSSVEKNNFTFSTNIGTK
jgi:hypothetical protein